MDSTLRSALRQVSQTLQADVPNVTGTLTRGALAGVSIDKMGQLQFDQKTFTAAMQDHPDDLLALFGNANSVQTDGSIIKTTGLGGALATVSDLLSRSGDGLAGVTTLGRMKTSTRADSIQTRLDRHAETLLSQFVAMETALARLQSQGAALTSQVKSLQSRITRPIRTAVIRQCLSRARSSVRVAGKLVVIVFDHVLNLRAPRVAIVPQRRTARSGDEKLAGNDGAADEH
jgi:flagellar capping protein FliD